MKVSKHVERLLRQGKKPKELVELGFPKRVVTRVYRQLREGSTSGRNPDPDPDGVARYNRNNMAESAVHGG